MRQVTYSNPFRYRGTYCPNMLLRCLDPRFHAALEGALPPWLTQWSGSSAFASMALPGAARALLDPVSRPVVLEALETAIAALEANRLVIANHVDCRAYGGSERLGSPAAEAAFHVEQLQLARQVVNEAYPRLEVVLLYQDWETIREVTD